MKKHSIILAVVLILAGCQSVDTERLHKEYYPNGNVKYEAFVDGHGGARIVKWFNEDGTPKNGTYKEGLYERTYKSGVVIGLNKYYQNGVLEYEASVDGNNTVTKLKEYGEDGRPKNGVCKEVFKPGYYREIPYKDGKKHGLQKSYEKNVLVVEWNWIDGKREHQKVFHKNGKTKYIIHYENEKQKTRKDFHDNGLLDCVRTIEKGVEIFRRYHGGKLSIEHRGKEYTAYHNDGSVRQTGRYDDNDKRHGIRRCFNEKGQLVREDSWSHGKRHGTFKVFRKSGTLLYEKRYKNDIFVYERVFDDDGNVTSEGKKETTGIQ